jgi:hypothetical protein
MTYFWHYLLGHLSALTATAFGGNGPRGALVLATLVVSLCSTAQAQNTTSGGCSPIVADNTAGGAVTVTLNCNFGASAEDSFEVQLLQANLSCNSEHEPADLASGYAKVHAPDFFERLKELDETFVYIDLRLGVGAGCGLYEIANQPAPRWGVVYDLNDKAPYSTNEYDPYLDGFPGPLEKYDYGYRIVFDSLRSSENVTCKRESLPGEADFIFCSPASTVLFPRDEGPFFNARYGKTFHLEGIAKIRITEWQAGQAVEIVPVATPVGGLADHYNRLKKYVRELRE